jgi:hypothetical protein
MPSQGQRYQERTSRMLSMSHVAMNLNPWTATVVISSINIWGVLEEHLRSRRIGLVSRGTPLVCMRSLFIQGNDGVMRCVPIPFENPCAVDGTDDLGRLNMAWLDLVPLALHSLSCGSGVASASVHLDHERRGRFMRFRYCSVFRDIIRIDFIARIFLWKRGGLPRPFQIQDIVQILM